VRSTLVGALLLSAVALLGSKAVPFEGPEQGTESPGPAATGSLESQAVEAPRTQLRLRRPQARGPRSSRLLTLRPEPTAMARLQRLDPAPAPPLPAAPAPLPVRLLTGRRNE